MFLYWREFRHCFAAGIIVWESATGPPENSLSGKTKRGIFSRHLQIQVPGLAS